VVFKTLFSKVGVARKLLQPGMTSCYICMGWCLDITFPIYSFLVVNS